MLIKFYHAVQDDITKPPLLKQIYVKLLKIQSTLTFR